METSDGLEMSESEKAVPYKHSPSEKPSKLTLDTTLVGKQPPPAAGSSPSVPSQGKPTGDKDELKPDDLEWASQQSTETGSLDGSCRDVLNSSITSTTSTLVPGMLEEEDDEEEEEEDYTHEPTSEEVQLNSRIESWVSETQRTMETLQLGKALPGSEEDSAEQSGEEAVEAPEGLESGVDGEPWTPDQQPRPSSSVNKEHSDASSAPQST